MIGVHLLGRFEVTRAGVAIDVPGSAHRLLAFLALQDGPVERSYTSSCLWLDRRQDRAHANLRSVLWRLRRWGSELVVASATQLSLAPQVEVDIRALLSLARALVDESRLIDLDGVDGQALASDLLPGWHDDFVELERERFRQLRLHALEALARRLARLGSYGAALDAALIAVAAEPLRESAHRTVIEVHLAEGNRGEAVRQYRSLKQILQQQLGIAPSPRTVEVIAADLDGRSDPVGLPQPADRFAGINRCAGNNWCAGTNVSLSTGLPAAAGRVSPLLPAAMLDVHATPSTLVSPATCRSVPAGASVKDR